MSRVALIQMVSSANVNENLSTLEPYFLNAREVGAALLVLPENLGFMGARDEDKLKIAEDFGDGVIQHTLSQLAKSYQIWVIAGSIFLKTPTKRVRASCIVYDSEGQCVARYDKIHLFDVRVSTDESYQESLTIEPGNTPVVVDTPIGRVGLTICYDLRFPELYRQLVLKGAELFTVPAAFTAVTGNAHWNSLLRARAIENVCYVIAPNQGGRHANGRDTHGHSMIVDPWGTVISELTYGPGLIYADIDLQHLRQLRLRFPCNEHHVLGAV